MPHNCIIEKGKAIYRYDLVEPPREWDITFKSDEYSENKYGQPKNLANLFFFFSNEEVANKTAIMAVKKHCNKYDGFWLTETMAVRDINLLCLCGSDLFLQIITLYEEGIDIFNDNFKYYVDGEYVSFITLKDYYDELIHLLTGGYLDIERRLELINCIKKPFQHFGYPFGTLGQTLTDFGNGIIFSKILSEKGCDGYVFDESVGGHTICLLPDVVIGENPSISTPQNKYITLN